MGRRLRFSRRLSPLRRATRIVTAMHVWRIDHSSAHRRRTGVTFLFVLLACVRQREHVLTVVGARRVDA